MTARPSGRIRRYAPVLAPIAVGAVAIALGAATVMPGVGYWDTGEFQTVGPLLGTAHPTGYPTYVILGWLASVILQPFGEPALRMNLLSAIFVGVAAGLTVDLVRLLTRSLVLGVAAGLGLAATPVVWSIGTHADPHALHLAFVAALLWLLVRWEQAERTPEALADGIVGRGDRWLIAAAAVFGLSAGNHSLTLLLAPSIGLFVLAVEPDIIGRRRFIAACVAALVGAFALVTLELVLRAGVFRAPMVYGSPDTLGGLVYVLLAEQFRGGIENPFADLAGKADELAGIATNQFGLLAGMIPLGAIATALRQPNYALLSISAVVIGVLFNASYENADIDRYYLGPVLIAWTWLAILAAALIDLVTPDTAAAANASSTDDDAGLVSGEPDRGPAAWPRLAAIGLAAVLIVGPSIASAPAVGAAVSRHSDPGARPWLDGVLRAVEPNAVIVSWWSYSTPLWYAQLIEGRRPDVAVVDDRTRLDLGLGDVTDVIDANLAERPVYVIRVFPSEIDALKLRYQLVPLGPDDFGNVYRVLPRQDPG